LELIPAKYYYGDKDSAVSSLPFFVLLCFSILRERLMRFAAAEAMEQAQANQSTERYCEEGEIGP